MTSRLTVTDNLPAMLAAVKKLTSQEVLVGVPQEESARPGQQITNAALAYIHDNGAPEQNIPARPFMRPGIEAVRDKIEKSLASAAKAALDGNAAGTEAGLMKAGLAAQTSIQGVIADGDFVPLAYATIQARAREHRTRTGLRDELAARDAGYGPEDKAARAAAGIEQANVNAKPLNDTLGLKNSIEYVIVKKD